MIPEIQSYLEKTINDASRRRQFFYISIDAIEKPQLKLMAKKVAEKKQDGQEESVSPVPVLEGIQAFYAEHRHVLLVGRPGSGKSTALNQLLIAEATRSLENSSLPIPVLVQLKSDQPILELIRKALLRGRLRRNETEIEDLLFEGRLLLLLDGINEIPRQDLQQKLQEFREDNPDVPMIFTTRDLAGGGYLGIEKQLEMQPLTPAQLREFVGRSFPEQTEQFLNQLSDRLKELGKTPLLLEMLCDVFRRTGKIPNNLGLVFREFTQHYERNLKEGVRVESDRELWKLVLQHLAWVMMQGKEPTEFRVAIEREEAVRAIGQFLNEEFPYVEARKCLRDLQKHHLIQAGTNLEELEFRHQLIQEYYAAETLLARLLELSDDVLKREYLNYLKWTEPLALMSALVESEKQALRVVKLALEVSLVLGGRLAGEVNPCFQQQTVKYVAQLELDQELRIRLLCLTRSKLAIHYLREFLVQYRGRIYVRQLSLNLRGETEHFGSAITLKLQRINDNVDVDFIGIDKLSDTALTSNTSSKVQQNIFSSSLDPSTSSKLPDWTITLCMSREAVFQSRIAFLLCEGNSFGFGEDLFWYGVDSNVLKTFDRSIVVSALVDGLTDQSPDIRSLSIKILGAMRELSTVPLLCEALKDEEENISIDAIHALSVIIEPEQLTFLSRCLLKITARLEELMDSLLKKFVAIQENRKYYNCEIFQAYLEAQKPDRPKSQNSDRSPTTTNHFPNATEVKIFENVDRYHEAPPPPKDPPS